MIISLLECSCENRNNVLIVLLQVAVMITCTCSFMLPVRGGQEDVLLSSSSSGKTCTSNLKTEF